MGSPARTLSPSLTNHFWMVPSSMVSESLGICTLLAITGSSGPDVQSDLHPGDDAVLVGACELLQRHRIRHRHVGAGDTDDGAVEQVEAVPLDDIGDLRTHVEVGPALLDDDARPSLAHAVDD